VSTRVCVAQIGAAHGIRGEVRLWTFTEDPLAVLQYGPLESEDASRRFEITHVRAAQKYLVARVAGISDRNAAETLRNIKLYVARDKLPPTDDADTFYHADLIGLDAVSDSGAPIGTVAAVHNFGAGDIIEIAPAGSGDTLLFPFTQEVVPSVDLAARRIVVVPPPSSEARDDKPSD
jgi:16S rRNA processing protein RimM